MTTKEKANLKEEVGYVLLEECEVLVMDITPSFVDASTTDEEASSSDDSTSPFQWHDIDIRSVPIGECMSDNSDDGRDLILRPSKNDTGIKHRSWENVNEILPFHGLISEVINHESKKQYRRSDASLLLGLGIEINKQSDQFLQELSRGEDSSMDGNDVNLRHLRMTNAQIVFWQSNDGAKPGDAGIMQDKSDEENQSSSSVSQESSSSSMKRVKASMLVTFSLPIDVCHGYSSTTKSVGELKNVQTKKAKTKSLSTAIQLLASIIRCDWNHLDSTVKVLQQKALANTKTTNARDCQVRRHSFFPESLNVQELYGRISGASQHFSQEENHNDVFTRDSKSEITEFMDLPMDIISKSIAPYLRAKSLYSLRVTNRKLYKSSLREVVPGLKLTLIRHQIRSLEWMEMRERHSISEGDLLCRHRDRFLTKSHLCEGEDLCGGDYHRAVTGGSTVLLATRPNGGGDVQRVIRFDVESGRKVAPLHSPLERRTLCARGG
jgi:hypothetical protein